jgi:AcrR family transcriptional regulator
MNERDELVIDTGKRRTRDREQTAARILAAVGETLSTDGFSGIGINTIAKRAGVDKVLIYRYFGGLPELLTAYGKSGAFWPSVNDLLGDDSEVFLALPLAERYCRFLEHFIDELRTRPLTLEILAQEVIERNELTAILESERETWGQQAAALVGGERFARVPGSRGTTILLIAGIQYLLLRSRKIRTFGGFDLRSDDGWRELRADVRSMVLAWFGSSQ